MIHLIIIFGESEAAGVCPPWSRKLSVHGRSAAEFQLHVHEDSIGALEGI